MVKVWDIDENGAKFVTQFSDLNIGSILSLSPNPDLPFVIAVGGDNNKAENIKIVDISKSKQGKFRSQQGVTLFNFVNIYSSLAF